jgi:hypothetical protein
MVDVLEAVAAFFDGEKDRKKEDERKMDFFK